MIHFTKCHVKSLQITDSDETTAFMQSLDPGVFTSLETWRVNLYYKEPVWLADILTESARTLRCLSLSPLADKSLSGISITALTGLTCLQSLYLDGVLMTHSNLICLYAYISQATTLTQLMLNLIHCSDHMYQYHDCDVILNLHPLYELKMLHLSVVPYKELHVNLACLEKLKFEPPLEIYMAARARANLLQNLRAAPVLSSLTLKVTDCCQEMVKTIATLTQLQYLKLESTYMDMDVILLSPAMKKLECVELSSVTMTSAAWRELVHSVGQLPQSITIKLKRIRMTWQEWRELFLSVGGLQHPVTVELYKCEGLSREEWRTIVDVIKTMPTLSLLQDLSSDKYGGSSLTLKSRPV